MSNPGLHKLNRIAYYLMVTDVPKTEMQGRYDACTIINKIIKEIQLGVLIKKAKSNERKGRLPK